MLLRAFCCVSFLLLMFHNANGLCDSTDLPTLVEAKQSEIHPVLYVRARTVFCMVHENTIEQLKALFKQSLPEDHNHDFLDPDKLADEIWSRLELPEGTNTFGQNRAAFLTFEKSMTASLSALGDESFTKCDKDEDKSLTFEEYIDCLDSRHIPYDLQTVKSLYAHIIENTTEDEELTDEEIAKKLKERITLEDFGDLEMSLNFR